MPFSAPTIPAEKIVERQDFQQALITAITNSSILSPRHLQQIEEAAEVQVGHSGGQYRQCEGDGAILTSAAGPWRVRIVNEWRPRPDGRPGRGPYRGFLVSARGTALLVEGASEEADIQFSPLTLSFRG